MFREIVNLFHFVCRNVSIYDVLQLTLDSTNRTIVPSNSRNNVLERVAQNPIRFHEENGMMVPDGKVFTLKRSNHLQEFSQVIRLV